MTRDVQIRREGTIPDIAAGQRVDRALADLFPDFSRSRLQQWLKAGEIVVAGTTPRPRDTVEGGESVFIAATLSESGPVEAEPFTLDIRFEDEHLLVVAKPAGLVVHPGAGNPDGTLQNALLHQEPALCAIPRAGIVHRLDRETSGLMVIAKTLAAHKALVEQLQARTVGREYLALATGTFTAGGHVNAAIGRHPRDRTRMTVRQDGREAVTHYRIEERFPAHTLLRCRLETGRTHQIRVHLAHIRHPLVGDPVYGGRLSLPPGATPEVSDALRQFRRQALHAQRLSLKHPATGQTLCWELEVPEDLAGLLDVVRQHREQGSGRGRPSPD